MRASLALATKTLTKAVLVVLVLAALSFQQVMAESGTPSGNAVSKLDKSETHQSANSSFNECAASFFTPTLPRDIKSLGLKYTPQYTYAWFIDVIQRVIPEEDGDLRLQRVKPYFTDRGWSELSNFIKNQVQPHFSTPPYPVLITSLMAAPRIVQAISLLDEHKSRIGSKTTFEVKFSLRYIHQAVNVAEAKSTERFITVLVTVLHFDEVQALKIDEWKVNSTTE